MKFFSCDFQAHDLNLYDLYMCVNEKKMKKKIFSNFSTLNFIVFAFSVFVLFCFCCHFCFLFNRWFSISYPIPTKKKEKKKNKWMNFLSYFIIIWRLVLLKIKWNSFSSSSSCGVRLGFKWNSMNSFIVNSYWLLLRRTNLLVDWMTD